jgi:hypothetical protein
MSYCQKAYLASKRPIGDRQDSHYAAATTSSSDLSRIERAREAARTDRQPTPTWCINFCGGGVLVLVLLSNLGYACSKLSDPNTPPAIHYGVLMVASQYNAGETALFNSY